MENNTILSFKYINNEKVYIKQKEISHVYSEGGLVAIITKHNIKILVKDKLQDVLDITF